MPPSDFKTENLRFFLMSQLSEQRVPLQTAVSPGSKPLHAPLKAEIAALIALGFVVFIATISLARSYFAQIDNFGDSLGYMHLAAAIRHWDFRGIIIKQFWGLPYTMAAFSKLTGASDRSALLLFSMGPSLLASVLATELWDGWIAAYFAILNFDWLQRSCLGGSEPLFVCLIFATFASVRRERWLWAALLASFATVVRPLGLFALIGVGIVLLVRRDFRKFAVATAIGLVIGFLYVIPLAAHFGDTLATVHSYHSEQWQGGWLFGFPFYAIVKGTLLYPAPWTNLVLSFGWIVFILLGVIVMARSTEFRSYSRAHLVETIFLVPYLWCLFTYNYPYWARGNFARFAIPVLPFVLLSLHRWIPKDRRVLWPLAIVMPLLAACSALGVANVGRMLRSALRT
jgi:hypothetical protein